MTFLILKHFIGFQNGLESYVQAIVFTVENAQWCNPVLLHEKENVWTPQ
jgi:hypothetical protein